MSDQVTTSIGAGAPQESFDTAGSILIVDDEQAGCEILAALLLTQHYQLHFAGNGEEALVKVAAIQPDLVLLDVMMPGLDGFEVCRRIRADPLLGEVPVIMLTALDDRDSRLRGIEAGADDFVSKPFDRVELRARVKTITRLNRYRRLLAERAKLARVIEFAPDGLLIVDQAGTIVLANPAIAQLLGAPGADQLLGQHVASLLVSAQRAACQACLERVLAGDGAVRVESMLVSSNGVRVPIEMHIGFLSWNDQPAAQIIAHDDHWLRLEIQDWGCGFEPAEVLSGAGLGERIGLRGMRERAAILGGRWSVRSSPGNGTLVVAEIPLPPENGGDITS